MAEDEQDQQPEGAEPEQVMRRTMDVVPVPFEFELLPVTSGEGNFILMRIFAFNGSFAFFFSPEGFEQMAEKGLEMSGKLKIVVPQGSGGLIRG